MDFALWNLAALAAFFIKGLCGFANTLVFTTILSFSPAINRNISPVELLLGLGLGIVSGRLLNERRVKQTVVVMLMLSGGALLFNNL